MKKLLFLPLVAAGVVATTAGAQMAPPATATIRASEPGKAFISRTVDLEAKVVGIDAADRIVTLKGADGNTVDVLAGDEVKNFAQIHVGDKVVAHYSESWYFELASTKAGLRESVERQDMARAKPGEKPAGAAVREIVALVDVIAVDPVKKTITLKGPKNNVVTLPVQNPEQFKVVKAGDQVEATYTQALLIAVEAKK